MRQKPARKNAHKERIFGLHQNKTNFEYQKNRQSETGNKIHEICEEQGSIYKALLRKKGLYVA